MGCPGGSYSEKNKLDKVDIMIEHLKRFKDIRKIKQIKKEP